MPAGVPEDLAQWLGDRVAEIQILWAHVGTMNRSRGMWKILSEALEAADPTNPWTRNYDRLYFDSQLVTLTRMVFVKRGRQRQMPLTSVLEAFSLRPEVCGVLSPSHRIPNDRRGPVDPVGDKAAMMASVQRLMPWRPT